MPETYELDPAVTADLQKAAEGYPVRRYVTALDASGTERPGLTDSYRSLRYCFSSGPTTREDPRDLLDKAMTCLALKVEEALNGSGDIETVFVRDAASIEAAKARLDRRVSPWIDEGHSGHVVFVRSAKFAAAVGPVSGVEEVEETARVLDTDSDGKALGLRAVLGASDTAYLIYIDGPARDLTLCMSALQVRYFERHSYERRIGPNGLETRVVDDYCLHLAVPQFVTRLRIAL